LPPSDVNYYFEVANRNKRSIVLNVKNERGREVLYRLVEGADVFVSSWTERVLKNLAVDYDTLKRVNPKIVYVACSGWGEKGEGRGKGAFDLAVQGRSGLMYGCWNPEKKPLYLGLGYCDLTGGLQTAYAVLLGLVCRERSGIAQKLGVSLYSAALQMGILCTAATLEGGRPPLTDRLQMRNPLLNFYGTKDNRLIVLSMPMSDPYWPTFCKCLGLEELENDPKFKDHMTRIQNSKELTSILDKVFATKTQAEWMDIVKGSELIIDPVQTFEEAVEDPQAWANDYFIEVPTSRMKRQIGFLVQPSETPGSVRMPAPEFGQHTEEILLGLGYTWDDISKLKEVEAVG
jgi:crotonobetainyl-CoA:carnitine CoA-transferase CaiB-like acyl-CoA transferase